MRPRGSWLAALVCVGCGGNPDRPAAEPTRPPTRPAEAARPRSPADLVAEAGEFVRELGREEFEKARGRFDPTMAGAMSAEALGRLWNGFVSVYGPYRDVGEARTEKQGGYDVAYADAVFERAEVEVKVVFDAEGRVAGLFFAQPRSTVEYEPPAYVDRSKFSEREIRIGEGETSLPATLSVPAGTC